jgi:regulator of RNase E activity RraA
MRVTFRPTDTAFSDDDGIVVVAGGADPTVEVSVVST